MRYTSVLVAIGALPVLASCIPLEDSAGVRIPLNKHGSFVKDDGSFDMNRAIDHTVFIMNKHWQNMVNFKRNVGERAFNDGAEIKPLVTLPDGLQKRRDEPLSLSTGAGWVGPVNIGTPFKTFQVVLDTGSTDLWVTSDSCHTHDVCSSKTKYSSGDSSSGKKKDNFVYIIYLDGTGVFGSSFTDRVEMAGIRAEPQYFCSATSIVGNYSFDGILGLGYPYLSFLGQDSFFQTAMAQGFSPGEFGFYLRPTGSELYLGGTDRTKYIGEIEYHNVSNPGFWQIGNATLFIEGYAIVSNFETIIDTGTTFMYGPSDDVDFFFKALPDSTRVDVGSGTYFYMYPCDSPPLLSISWGEGFQWPISASNFWQARVSDKSDMCVSSLIGLDILLGNNTWLLGDSFMTSVYTAYNFDTNSIGFALPT